MAIPQGFQRAQARGRRRRSRSSAPSTPRATRSPRPTCGTSSRRRASTCPDGEFGGGLPRRTTLALLLDVSLLGPDQSVKDTANNLLKMMETGGGGGGGGAAPPFVTFRWGSVDLPKSVPVSLTIQYVLFHPNGEPIRATVDLELAQAEKASTASGSGHEPGPEPDDARAARAARPPGPRRRLAPLDRLRRLRRPDPLAPDRRGQRHRQPAAPAPRLASSRSRRSTTMPRDTSKEHVPTYEIARRRRRARAGAPRPDQGDPDRRPPAAPGRLHGEHLVPEDRAAIDSQPFDIGKSLEVRLGAREQQAPQILFKGEVVSLEPTFGAGGCALIVNAYDRAHLLHRSRKVRVFQNQTATDIVKKVVGEQGLALRGRLERRPARLHPAGQRDRLGLHLAARRALRVRVRRRRPEGATSASPASAGAVELEWPTTLSSFRPRMTAVQQVEHGHVCAHDPKTKRRSRRRPRPPEQIAQIGIDRAERSRARFPEAEMHVATEPVKSMARGHRARPGAARQARQRLHRRRGHGDPATRGSVPARWSRSRASASTFSGELPRRDRDAHAARRRRLRDARSPTRPSHTILGAIGNGGAAPRPTSAPSSCSASSPTTTTPTTWAASASSTRRSATTPRAPGRAIATAERRQRARAADAARSSARRCSSASSTATRTRPYVLGSLFNGIDKPGDELLHDKDGSFAVLSDKQHRDAGEGDVHDQGRRGPHDRGRRQAQETIQRRLDARGAGQGRDQGDPGDEPSRARASSVKGQADVTIEGSASLTLKCGGSQIQISAARRDHQRPA